MISDPKTTPDRRLGRVVFAALVAAGAYWITFGLYRTNGLLWSLVFFSFFVPLIDLVLPGAGLPVGRSGPIGPAPSRSQDETCRCRPARPPPSCSRAPSRPSAASSWPRPIRSCSSEASQVVLVRDGDRTVLTMVNDFKGDIREFAMVIPVPTILERGQIHVGNPAVVEHLDAYSGPSAGGVSRREPLPPDRLQGRAGPMLRFPLPRLRRRSEPGSWGSRSRPSTPWASTTS